MKKPTEAQMRVLSRLNLGDLLAAQYRQMGAHYTSQGYLREGVAAGTFAALQKSGWLQSSTSTHLGRQCWTISAAGREALRTDYQRRMADLGPERDSEGGY